MDDDGLDEIFIVFFASGSGSLKYSLLDPNDGTGAIRVTLDPSPSATSLDQWAQPSLAGGDRWVQKKAIAGPGVNCGSPVVAIGGTDLDSAPVRYDGDCELLFTKPQLVAVLASPPCQEGIDQDLDSTTATFGKVQGSSVVAGPSLGFSVGFECESDLHHRALRCLLVPHRLLTSPRGGRKGRHREPPTLSTGSIYEGTDGAIPGANDAEYSYCYGLMVYPQLASGQRFVVMEWWTQRPCGAP